MQINIPKKKFKMVEKLALTNFAIHKIYSKDIEYEILRVSWNERLISKIKFEIWN